MSKVTTKATSLATDHFRLLGLEERYDIDVRALEKNYLERSRKVHPDRFVNAPTSERVAALQDSMSLNQAYQTLADPAARAEYLLARCGVEIGENQRLDPGFLMEILEMREELADHKRARDRAALMRLEDAMLERRDQVLADIARLFAAHFADPDRAATDHGAARLAELEQRVVALRYVSRYLAEFDDIDDMDDEDPK